MIIDAVVGFFVNFIIVPIVSLFPEFTMPSFLTGGVGITIGQYAADIDAVIPIHGPLVLISSMIGLGVLLLPVIFVVWVWGAVRP